MPEMVNKIHNMVLNDSRLKVHELVDMVDRLKKCYTSHIDRKLRDDKAARKMGAMIAYNGTSAVGIIRMSIWQYFTAIKLSFCINLQPWAKYGFISLHT